MQSGMRGPAARPAPLARIHAGIPRSVAINMPPSLLCAICQDMVGDPVITPCNHIFCSSCMASAREHSDQCPNDRQQLPPSIPSLKTSNPALYRLWNEVKLSCPYAALVNCTWSGCGEDYPVHAAACKVQAEAAAHEGAAAQVAELRATVQALQAETQRLRIEAEPVAGLTAIVSRLTAEAAVLRNRNASLQASLSELQQGTHVHTDQLEEQVASWREEAAPVPSLRREVGHLTAQVAALTRSNAQLRGSFSSLQADKDRLQALSDDLSIQFESLQDTMDAFHIGFDPAHQYTKFRTVELARLILQHLEEALPPGVVANRIFNCISNIHNECQRGCVDNPEHLALDVMMLLGVARASTWFTVNQQVRLREIACKYT